MSDAINALILILIFAWRFGRNSMYQKQGLFQKVNLEDF
jgi:hypothetical protein